MFELALQDDQVRILQERHYSLVPADQVTARDKIVYARLARKGRIAIKRKL